MGDLNRWERAAVLLYLRAVILALGAGLFRRLAFAVLARPAYWLIRLAVLVTGRHEAMRGWWTQALATATGDRPQ